MAPLLQGGRNSDGRLQKERLEERRAADLLSHDTNTTVHTRLRLVQGDSVVLSDSYFSRLLQ